MWSPHLSSRKYKPVNPKKFVGSHFLKLQLANNLSKNVLEAMEVGDATYLGGGGPKKMNLAPVTVSFKNILLVDKKMIVFLTISKFQILEKCNFLDWKTNWILGLIFYIFFTFQDIVPGLICRNAVAKTGLSSLIRSKWRLPWETPSIFMEEILNHYSNWWQSWQNNFVLQPDLKQMQGLLKLFLFRLQQTSVTC